MSQSEFKNINLIRATRAYAKLSQDVEGAGILQRSYLYYSAVIAFTFGGFALSALGIFFFYDYFLLALACLGFSFFSIQFGGLMHDSGHRAVFSKTQNNDILGYICGGFLGMVFDNWKVRHNAHHANPNNEEEDPDIQIPFVATSPELFQKKKGLEKTLIKYQAYYYYPLGALVSFSNRLGAFSYFLNKPIIQNWWKLAVYLVGFLVLFPLPFIIFAPAKAIFVFFLVHITTGIYLANVFAPNHKGMPHVKAGMKLSFLEQQIITARNVDGGVLTDILLVGLNYQIEHHLFPNCPRNKLKLITPYAKKISKDLDLSYTSVNFIETNKIIVKELHASTLAV